MDRRLDIKVQRDEAGRDAWRVLVGVTDGQCGSYDVLPIPFTEKGDAEAVARVIESVGGPHFEAGERESARRWTERTISR